MFTSKIFKKAPRNKQHYEDLGRMLENIYESGYINRNQAYKMSFVKGMLSGLGGVLGATILVAVLLWILSLFSSFPLISKLSKNIQHTVQTEKR